MPFISKFVILYQQWRAHGSIAQLGEHLPYKQRVIGSSPIVPTIFITATCGNGSVVERRLAKANVASSNLVSRSIFFIKGFPYIIARRHRQAVRPGSAKPLPPVRIWVAPPNIKTRCLINYHLVLISIIVAVVAE